MNINISKAINDFVKGFMRYPIWLHQAYHLLSVKYKRTFLGTLWISGNFLISSISIAFVFGSIFNQNIKAFLPFCLLGNLLGATAIWALADSTEIFMSNTHLIRNNAIPFTYYVFESLAKMMMLFFHNLLMYFIITIALSMAIIPSPIAIIGIIVLPIVLFPYGFLVAMLSARFRDLRFLLPNLAAFMFFITPIYWMPELLPASRRIIADANPVYHLISIVRLPLLNQDIANLSWIYVSVIGLVGWLLLAIFFPIYRRRIPFWV
jgi:ABC-type polysaccharide/polyol phosphate export permease